MILEFFYAKFTQRWVIIVSIAVLFGGNYYLKTPTPLVDEKKTKLEISFISTGLEWEPYRSSDGYFDIEQNYTIKFGLIPWVKFKPDNISLIDLYGNPYYNSLNYGLSGEYVIINGSRWNSTNVIIKGKRHEYNLPKFYNLSKKQYNETVQIWDINFTNPYGFFIKIDEFVIVKNQQLKLINYNLNSVPDANLREQGSIFVSKVWLDPYVPNQSITLFFEKNSTI